jgi:hypothetical protein
MNNVRLGLRNFLAIFLVVAASVFAFMQSVPVYAAAGEGTSEIAIDGPGFAASVTAERAVASVLAVKLIVGATGITNDADSPTFTVPAGFTAPHASGGAPVPTGVGEVDVNGEWFAAGTGGTCAITMATSSASGQVITLDVTGACATTDVITLYYKGVSTVEMTATSFTVATDDATGGTVRTNIGTSPTVVVTDTVIPTVTVTAVSNNAVGDTIVLTYSEAMDTTSLTQAYVRAGTVLGLDYSNNAGNTGEANIVTTNATAVWSVSDTVLTITLNEAIDNAYIPGGKYIGATSDGTILDAYGAVQATAEVYSAAITAETDVPTVAVTATSVDAAGDTIVLTFNEMMDTTSLTQADVRAGTVLGLDYSDNAGNTNAANIVTTNATATWNTAKTVLTITLNEVTDKAYIPDGKYIGATSDGTIADAVGNFQATAEIYSAAIAKEAVVPTISSIALTNTTTITVTYSEMVKTPSTSTANNWTLSGGTGSPSIAAVQNIAAGSSTQTITISGYTGGQLQLLYTTAGSQDVSDLAGNNLVTTVAANVVDTTVPTITAADITSIDTTYVQPNDIDITLTFSETVTITGSPRITLNTTNATRYATYLSGSGTADIVFRYTVQPNDVSLDLGASGTDGLALNGGTILDGASNVATLTLPETMTATNAVIVNGVASGGSNSVVTTPTVTPATPAVPATPTVTPATPAVPATPATPEVTPAPQASPVAVLIHNPSKTDELLAALGTASKPAEFAKYTALVKSDALAYKIGLTEAQQTAIANFVTYGASSETVKLGAGERRAVMRDYMETVGRADVVWDDVQRLATGQKPVKRNLANEQAQVNQVLKNWMLMVGHAPNFKDASEDLAWNTMMYRIRFPRNLTTEKQGIVEFKQLYDRNPSTPLEWSVVRALGYALK